LVHQKGEIAKQEILAQLRVIASDCDAAVLEGARFNGPKI